MFMRMATAAALALWVPTVCMAGGEDRYKTLTIGDEAPKAEISHWLKGLPVDEFEDGKIYVMDFWATWCGPCKASIPHISELQEQYADYDVTFIGVSDEKLQKVVKFLTAADSKNVLWTDKIQYTLATDPDKSTYKAYMTPAAQQGIPTAFIIGKDSRIEWIGNPLDMDDVLPRVVRERLGPRGVQGQVRGRGRPGPQGAAGDGPRRRGRRARRLGQRDHGGQRPGQSPARAGRLQGAAVPQDAPRRTGAGVRLRPHADGRELGQGQA